MRFPGTITLVAIMAALINMPHSKNASDYDPYSMEHCGLEEIKNEYPCTGLSTVAWAKTSGGGPGVGMMEKAGLLTVTRVARRPLPAACDICGDDPFVWRFTLTEKGRALPYRLWADEAEKYCRDTSTLSDPSVPACRQSVSTYGHDGPNGAILGHGPDFTKRRKH